MAKNSEQYFEGTGRRKTSVARVRITENEKEHSYSVNDKKTEEFFGTEELVATLNSPLVATAMEKKFVITAKVRGGGMRDKQTQFNLRFHAPWLNLMVNFKELCAILIISSVIQEKRRERNQD